MRSPRSRAIDDDRILRRLRARDRRDPAHQRLRSGGATRRSRSSSTARSVPGLPAPVPWREIWVYSPRVEGIHLRGGPIARGGLRWSDRRDDFRTEILGLMKAQMVKNAVIVPTGAKGGFYPKQLPPIVQPRRLARRRHRKLPDLHPLAAVGHRQYRQRQGRPSRRRRHPRRRRSLFRRRRRQGHRDLLRRRQRASRSSADFWLGDAFASGGSNGYDHKAMGITAKGAWISVQRHFLEMGVDVQTDPITRRRLRRHVGRRVRQRHAAVEGDQAGRRVRPPPHLHRSRSRSGEQLEGAQAHVRSAAVELGRLRPQADVEGRRNLPAHAEVDPAERRSAPGAGHRAPVESIRRR